MTAAGAFDYSPSVLDLFLRRPYAGRLSAAPGVFAGQAGVRAQGSQVQFWIEREAGRVRQATFLAYGCPHTIAAAAWWAQSVQGLSIAEAREVSWREAESALAVPADKRGRLLIVEDAMRAALRAAAA